MMNCKGVFTAIIGTGASLMGEVNATAAESPNILFIIADDLGWADVGYHGSAIPTPNIDALARQGVEMDRFYSAPVSSPARAGVLTGRYPSRFGIRETVIPPWREYGLDTEQSTLADMLGENGYEHRAAVGKWHLGHGRKAYYPLNRGFNHFYGCLNGAIDYFTHERDGELDWHRNWDSSYDKGYSTDLIADEAVRCIGEYAPNKSPFFLYVAFNAPHSPYQAPEDEIAKFIPLNQFNVLKGKTKSNYIYKAMVSRMDSGIGRIIEALERSGEMENTLIIFMSDNGGVANLPGGSSSAPLRGYKFQEWDGGVRVVASIYWKGHFVQGVKMSQVAAFVDLAPTIAELIDARPAQPYDGVSLLPVLTGKSHKFSRDLYLGCGAAVNDNYKLILSGKNPKMNLQSDFLVYYPNDPYEKQNNIVNHVAETERLRSYIERYDTIRPSVAEIPYSEGRQGFIAPKEWRVTKP